MGDSDHSPMPDLGGTGMSDNNPDREALRNAVMVVVTNAMNFPERVQSRILGQDMGPLGDRLTDAILALGFRRQPEAVTEEQVEAAREAYRKASDPRRAREHEDYQAGDWMRAALIAASQTGEESR